MKRSLGIVILCLLCISQTVIAADTKPMTNEDVINLIQAKLPETTILMAIKSAKPGFDTSADGLIKLTTAGVPQTLIQAMIEANSGSARPVAPTSGTEAAKAPDAGFNPEEVILIDGGQQTPMRYLTPNIRTAMRALGFGGVATYAVLKGPRAAHRIKNAQPAFLVIVPNNAQPESYVTLVNFVVRKNDSREVLVGGGYMSYSTGVHPDRIVPTTSEKLADQARAPKGFTLYRLATAKNLVPGEYAFVLYNSQVKVSGFFPTGGDSYFDFGVDN